MSYDDAAAALTAKNFKPRQADKTEFSDTVDAGDVIGTEPAIGDHAPYGSEVVVHVSKGPDLVQVPSVFGMTFSDAFDYLAQLGFQTSIRGKLPPARSGAATVAGGRTPRRRATPPSPFGR